MTTAAARKAAAAKKAALASGEMVTVYLIGASHGGKHGDPREVTPEKASRLIENRLAISQEDAEKRLEREIRDT